MKVRWASNLTQPSNIQHCRVASWAVHWQFNIPIFSNWRGVNNDRCTQHLEGVVGKGIGIQHLYNSQAHLTNISIITHSNAQKNMSWILYGLIENATWMLEAFQMLFDTHCVEHVCPLYSYAGRISTTVQYNLGRDMHVRLFLRPSVFNIHIFSYQCHSYLQSATPDFPHEISKYGKHPVSLDDSFFFLI